MNIEFHNFTMADKGIPPVFMKQRDLRMTDITPFMICEAMSKQVGDKNVSGAQYIRHRGLWYLYLKDKASRIKLLIKREIMIFGRSIPLYDNDPWSNNGKTKENEMDKLTLKFIPLFVDNADVKSMLVSNGVEILSDIKYGAERDGNGNVTRWMNGDRYVFIKPLNPPIKRQQTVAGFQCEIIHHGKDNKPCHACNQVGHTVGSKNCPAYPTEKIYTFRGFAHPLSNHYEYDLAIWGRNFKSNEHAFYWRMAMDMDKLDLAERIKNAKHGGAARAIGKGIADEEIRLKWELTNGPIIMQELQYTKCNQCPDFLQCLYDNKDHHFAESGPNKLWGSGISEYVTQNTSPKFWPGKNMMGDILNEIAATTSDIITKVVKPGGAIQVLEMLEFDELEKIERLIEHEKRRSLSDSTQHDTVTNMRDAQHPPDIMLSDSDQNAHQSIEHAMTASNPSIDCEVTSKQNTLHKNDFSKSCPSLQNSTGEPLGQKQTSKNKEFPQNLDDFYKYLDEYPKFNAVKRKNPASSPDHTCDQDAKAAKIEDRDADDPPSVPPHHNSTDSINDACQFDDCYDSLDNVERVGD